MDIATILGLIVGFGAVAIGYRMDNGNLGALWLASAFVIVVGGSIGAVAVSHGVKDVMKMPILFAKLFRKPKSTLANTVDFIVMLAENARRDGLLSIEKLIDTDRDDVDPLLKRGMLLVIDGADLEQIREIMETDTYVYERNAKAEVTPFDSFAGYAPAFGMVGTIMGLIQVLGNMKSMEQMVSSIAVAFITTFYGVILANLVFIPAGNKLRERISDNMLEKEMIVEGVCSIRNGQNPKMLRDKLTIYLQGEKEIKTKRS